MGRKLGDEGGAHISRISALLRSETDIKHISTTGRYSENAAIHSLQEGSQKNSVMLVQ